MVIFLSERLFPLQYAVILSGIMSNFKGKYHQVILNVVTLHEKVTSITEAPLQPSHTVTTCRLLSAE